MPALAGAFVHDLWEVRGQLAPERSLEITIGFVTAFLAALLVVKPFVRYVARAGFAPFAWYRIVAGLVILAAESAGWL
jgi:undecaprenyl-diphosphatase